MPAASDASSNASRPPPVQSIFVASNSTTTAGTRISSSSAANSSTNNNTRSSISNVDTFCRAVHKVRLSALAHNYGEVESAAGRQRCSVIVVVKADGYGHGAIQTALYLADTVGADCFAVATLEEAVSLRRAFAQTAPTAVASGVGIGGGPAPGAGAGNGGASVAFGDDLASTSMSVARMSLSRPRQARQSLRQAYIRIIVLGPPVGFPRCFDDYYHHNIECMISGPEVAHALLEWVLNKDERKRTQVERAAAEAKERILLEETSGPVASAGAGPGLNKRTTLLSMDSNISDGGSTVGGDANSQTSGSERSSSGGFGVAGNNGTMNGAPRKPSSALFSATLGNVTGSDLAREVREILRTQQKSQLQQLQSQHQPPSRMASSTGSGDMTPPTATSTMTPSTSSHDRPRQVGPNNNTGIANGPVQVFAGIEEAAKYSRTRHKAVTSEVFHDRGDDDDEEENDVIHDQAGNGIVNAGNDPQRIIDSNDNYAISSNAEKSLPSKIAMSNNHSSSPVPDRPRLPPNKGRNTGSFVVPFRKRLRWHAMVDSGMGRLGFKTDPVTKEEQGKRRDSVEIIQELVNLEKSLDCPVEFFGMCTHMADANSTSTYTHSQITKFKTLLRRVRSAGVFIPTISTDNSAALLTTNLTHFDPAELLAQADANSRGFVRTGGAVYGQRPSFPQLQAVSTLMASVRHVAVLKKGDSVGYDRAYVAPMSVRIATLTIGFADGYPRELGNGVGKVSIRGHLFPVAGNVCMDMLMVELGPAGDKHGVGAQVVLGDTAILWGPDDGERGEGHVRLQDLAAILKTTQSALTCGLNKERVLRQYA